MGGADGGGEAVDAGLADEFDGLVEGDNGAAFVGADAVFDALDGFQFAFDGDAVGVGVGHHFFGLGHVLFVGQLGGVKEHGIPAGFDALGDDGAVGAVVEVQGGGDGDSVGHLFKHQADQAGAHHLDGLHRHPGR